MAPRDDQPDNLLSDLESPFLNEASFEDFFGGEGEWEAQLARLEAESPFVSGYGSPWSRAGTSEVEEEGYDSVGEFGEEAQLYFEDAGAGYAQAYADQFGELYEEQVGGGGVPAWAAAIEPFPTTPTLAFHTNDASMTSAFASVRTGSARHLCAAVVDLSGSSVRLPYAGLNDNEMIYAGSMVKKCAMYAAFALRAQVQAFVDAAKANGALVVAPAITAEIEKAWKPKLLKLFPTHSTTSFGNKQDVTFPKLETIFTFAPDGKVEFAKAAPAMTDAALDRAGEFGRPPGKFHEWLRLTMRWSNNTAAGQCILALGYFYINGALDQAGFFDSASKRGLWVSGDYRGFDWVSTPADKKADAAGQPLTARWATAQRRPRSNLTATAEQSVRFMTLLALGKLVAADTVHPDPNEEMRQMTQSAIRCVRGGACGIGSYVKAALDMRPRRAFTALASKIGYGNDSFSHDCAIVERTVDGKKLKYAVVGLGSAPARSRRDLSDLFRQLDQVIVARNRPPAHSPEAPEEFTFGGEGENEETFAFDSLEFDTPAYESFAYDARGYDAFANDSFAYDELAYDEGEDGAALFEQVLAQPPKRTPEAIRQKPHFQVVNEKGEDLTEGKYVFHQGQIRQEGDFSPNSKGLAFLGNIDPARPFIFEVRDRVCVIRNGAFINPDDLKIEYGGTRFDWRLVRDDRQAEKNFWPYYHKEMDLAFTNEPGESTTNRPVDRFLQHEHITRRPIQVAKPFLGQLSRVKICATPPQIRVGPFVRYTDHQMVAIWLETVTPCLVRIRFKKGSGGREFAAYSSTVRVGGRHFSITQIKGLEPEAFYDYTVELVPLPATGPVPVSVTDVEKAFPTMTVQVINSINLQVSQAAILEGNRWLTFRTLRSKYDKRLHFATGSCRWYPGDKKKGKDDFKPDMLHGFGEYLRSTPKEKWPSFAFYGGDQIYSDEIGDNHGVMLRRGRFAARVPGPVDSAFSVRTLLIDGAWAGRFAHRYQLYKDPAAKYVNEVKADLKKLDDVHSRNPIIRRVYRQYPDADPEKKLKELYETYRNRRQMGRPKGPEDPDEREAHQAVANLPLVKALEVKVDPYRAIQPHWEAGFSAAVRRNPMGHRYLSYNFLLWKIPDFERQLPTLVNSGEYTVVKKPDGRGHPSVEEGVHAADFAEYAYLYERAWTTTRPVRVALAHIPTFLMFDDHEMTDDWNFDAAWVRMLYNDKDEWLMWPKTLTDALAAYWLYQGWGNRAAAHWKAGDPRIKALTDAQREGIDALPELRRCFYRIYFGNRPSKEPKAVFQASLSLDWHYKLPFDPPFLVPDCRMRRRLVPSDEKLRIINHDSAGSAPKSQTIDDEQLTWLRSHLIGKGQGAPVAFIAPSTPLLLQEKVMDIMQKPELVAGAWADKIDLTTFLTLGLSTTKTAIASDELIYIFRRATDVEHMIRDKSWRDLWQLVEEMQKARSPVKSLIFVSGDIHHSHCMTANLPGSGRPEPEVVQITCSGLQTTIRADRTTKAAESLSGLPFRVGKYRLVPGFVSKNDRSAPDQVLYQNAVALVDVSLGSNVNVVVTYLTDLTGKDKHLFRYTSGAAYMKGNVPAVLAAHMGKHAYESADESFFSDEGWRLEPGPREAGYLYTERGEGEWEEDEGALVDFESLYQFHLDPD